MKLSFRQRWLNKACKITGKSLEYIFYDKETYEEAIRLIRNSDTIKPNRIINKLRDYGKENGLYTWRMDNRIKREYVKKTIINS